MSNKNSMSTIISFVESALNNAIGGFRIANNDTYNIQIVSSRIIYGNFEYTINVNYKNEEPVTVTKKFILPEYYPGFASSLCHKLNKEILERMFRLINYGKKVKLENVLEIFNIADDFLIVDVEKQ